MRGKVLPVGTLPLSSASALTRPSPPKRGGKKAAPDRDRILAARVFSISRRNAPGRVALLDGGDSPPRLMTATEDQARSIFFAALDRTPAGWPAFLAEACGTDAELPARVGQLLDAHQAIGSIHGPAPMRRPPRPPARPAMAPARRSARTSWWR